MSSVCEVCDRVRDHVCVYVCVGGYVCVHVCHMCVVCDRVCEYVYTCVGEVTCA